MSFIEISNVSKFWGDIKAVENLNISVDEGEFVVLLGPSGCGKSTTLRLIAGLESVTSGEISIAGKNVNNLDPSLRNISMVFQSYALFPHLNVEENIVFGLKVRNVKSVERQSRLKKVTEKVGLTNYLERKPAELSGGQRQQVAVGRALMTKPSVLMLDEPTAGVSPIVMDELFDRIIEIKNTGVAIIIVEQNAKQALSIADFGYVLVGGKNMFTGKGNELLNNPEVRKAFLGG